MIALDTNILIRLVVDDSPAQSNIAAQLVRDNQVFIAKTVLMESEWVLRHAYRFSRAQIEEFLLAVLDTSNTVVEDRPQVERAMEWYRQGADFADALHLAAADTALFHTFDQRFCKAARKAKSAPEVRVLEV